MEFRGDSWPNWTGCDRLAARYDDEVLSSFDSDLSGAIERCLDGLAGPDKTVLDLGCGVGKYLAGLAERFGRVVAVDHSEKLLEIARRDHGERRNVEIRRLDASDGRAVRGVRAHVVVCANVVIMADGELRDAILQVARKSMKRDGRLVLVVPSLESALLAQRRLAEWHERDGAEAPEEDAEEEGLAPSKRTCRELLRGVVRIGDVPTKHHLADELLLTLRRAGLDLEELDRVHYPWESEFGDAPHWMRDPYPWDWLAVASRRR